MPFYLSMPALSLNMLSVVCLFYVSLYTFKTVQKKKFKKK